MLGIKNLEYMTPLQGCFFSIHFPGALPLAIILCPFRAVTRKEIHVIHDSKTIPTGLVGESRTSRPGGPGRT